VIYAHCIIISGNPDPTSWVIEWVEPYLDEDGYPIEDMCGKVLYFYLVNDSPVFAETKEELQEAYPDLYETRNNDGDLIGYAPPMSFAFINGTCFDNPIMLKRNPGYVSKLKAGSRVDVERYLKGNWKIMPEGSNYFDRSWLTKVDSIPEGSVACRAWDLAGTEPSEKNRYPDYTACTKLWRTPQGRYIIVGDFHPTCKEVKKNTRDIRGRFRLRPGTRDEIIINQAESDGKECYVVIPQDSASAGKQVAELMWSAISSEGFICHIDRVDKKNKLKKFEPFSAAAMNGMVDILEDSFPNVASLNAYLTELEEFDGSPSTGLRKDDWVDSTSSCFNYLNNAPIYPKFNLSDKQQKSTIGHSAIQEIKTITGL